MKLKFFSCVMVKAIKVRDWSVVAKRLYHNGFVWTNCQWPNTTLIYVKNHKKLCYVCRVYRTEKDLESTSLQHYTSTAESLKSMILPLKFVKVCPMEKQLLLLWVFEPFIFISIWLVDYFLIPQSVYIVTPLCNAIGWYF